MSNNNLGTKGQLAGILAFTAGIAEIGIGVYNITQGQFSEGVEDICIGGIALIATGTYLKTFEN